MFAISNSPKSRYDEIMVSKMILTIQLRVTISIPSNKKDDKSKIAFLLIEKCFSIKSHTEQ